MNIEDKDIRRALLERYLDADTTPEEEEALRKWFQNNPPLKEEREVALLLGYRQSPEPLSESSREWYRLVGGRTLGWTMAGLAAAAAILLAVILPGREAPTEQTEPEESAISLIESISSIARMDPSSAQHYEFEKKGDGFIMTAYFEDGTKASYIMYKQDSSPDTYGFLAINSDNE